MSDTEGERLAKSGLTAEAAEDVRVVAKGGAIQIAGQFSQRGLSYVFGILFNLILSTASYGLYRLVAQILTNLSQLGLAGFNYASMRWITRARAAGDPGGVRGAMRVGIGGALLASILVTIALLFFTEPIANFFEPDASSTPATGNLVADTSSQLFPKFRDQASTLDELLLLGAPYVALFAMMQVLRYCTQAYKTMVPSVMVGNIIQPIARTIIGVGLLLAGAGVAGAVIGLNVSIAISMVVAVWYLRRLLTPEQLSATPTYPVGPMTRFAIPQAGASLLGVQTLGLGILILGRYDTNFAVGLFAIALSLQGPGNIFLGGIVNIWAPVVSDLYERKDIDRLGALYQTINRWIVTFSFPVFAALILLPDVFTFFYQRPEAASVVAILALGNLFYTGTGPTGYVISMTGHPGVNFLNSLVAVVLYVVLGVIVVPEHGAVGMAWVDAGVTILINSARVIEAKVLVGVQPFGRTFYKPVVATVAVAAVLAPWRLFAGDSIAVQAVGLGIGLVVYLAVLKMLGIDAEERMVLNRIKKRAFKRGKS